MADVVNATDPFNETFVCKYAFRAPTTGMQYEDVLMMAWYFGCQVLFERNIGTAPLDYFTFAKCAAFVMYLPGQKEFGIYTDGHGTVVQAIADYTEAYINDRIEKTFFKSLINDWLNFEIKNTLKYDEAMAAGFALVAARVKSYKRQVDSGRDVSDYFPTYQAN
jgi:hypothetical protein